ncbi:hypothetical protein KDJ21_022790 [Metabacillus litoralis]|uniref:hypothetical protein n=1 Tax=Metabacillus TaxID=2675233 RepID=UPI001B9407CD|nr:hypothetical protein [Metabacillus litoralis]MCM3160193.1 hypothetical protein [Metabacillus litoralis]MCM3408779.1 hypothetical protein [Metabacillus litoralis]UHA59569.1 hypothetical protein KDJ21_022790 [Metabacillus litoralis]
MIKAIVFDVYGILFNVHSVVEKCTSLYPEKDMNLVNFGEENIRVLFFEVAYV